MNGKSFFLLTSVFILLNCGGGSKASENTDSLEEDSQSPIYVFLEDILQKEDTEPLSSIASEIVYIPLETSGNSLLREINRIENLDGNYVISDFYNIYLFNNDGKYIKRVAQKGGGPSDYIWVNNIIVDPTTNVLYLFTTYKVVKFNKSANYIDNFRIEDNKKESLYSRGIFSPNNTIFLGEANRPILYGDTTTVYNVIEIDTMGHVINKYINHSPRYVRIMKIPLTSDINFYKINNNVRFMDFGNDTIYSITNNSITPYAILDLGENKADHNPELSNIELNKVIEFLNNMKGLSVREVFENDFFLFMSLSKKGLDGDIINCLYNKRTKKVKLLKDGGLLNNLDGSLSFFPQKTFKDNELVSWKSAEEFKKEILSLDYNAQKTKYGDRFEKVYQLAKSLKEDDNPVLIIAKK